MGFTTLHGMETNVNETIINYGNVGFGLIMDTRLVPLMRLVVWGSPSSGLGSRNDLVIFLGMWMVCYQIYAMNGDDALVNEGRFLWFHDCV